MLCWPGLYQSCLNSSASKRVGALLSEAISTAVWAGSSSPGRRCSVTPWVKRWTLGFGVKQEWSEAKRYPPRWLPGPHAVPAALGCQLPSTQDVQQPSSDVWLVAMGWWVLVLCAHPHCGNPTPAPGTAGTTTDLRRAAWCLGVVTVAWWQGWWCGHRSVVAGVASWSLCSLGCLLQGLCESCPCVAEYQFKRNGKRNLNFVLKRQKCFREPQGVVTGPPRELLFSLLQPLHKSCFSAWKWCKHPPWKMCFTAIPIAWCLS